MSESQEHFIFSDVFVDVVAESGRKWNVQILIESVDNERDKIKYIIAYFDKESDAAKYADSLMYIYDKAIFEFEILSK